MKSYAISVVTFQLSYYLLHLLCPAPLCREGAALALLKSESESNAKRAWIVTRKDLLGFLISCDYTWCLLFGQQGAHTNTHTHTPLLLLCGCCPTSRVVVAFTLCCQHFCTWLSCKMFNDSDCDCVDVDIDVFVGFGFGASNILKSNWQPS